MYGDVRVTKREWLRPSHDDAGADLYLCFEPSLGFIVNNIVLFLYNPVI